MKGLPVTIRLLDPPLHEFLPHNEKDQAELATSLGCRSSRSADRVAAAARGQPDARPPRRPPGRSPTPRSWRCRSGRSSRPPCECKKQGIKVLPEIMIPLAGTKKELDYLKKFTVETAEAVMKETGRRRSSTCTAR